MADPRAAPHVLRQSKQAKMLGVTLDDVGGEPAPLSPLSQHPVSPGSSSPGRRPPSQPRMRSTGSGGLEGWNGWAAPPAADARNPTAAHAAYTGAPLGRVESGISPLVNAPPSTSSAGRPSVEVSLSKKRVCQRDAKIDARPADQTKRKASILPLGSNSNLRGSRSASGLRAAPEKDSSQSGSGRRRGLFGGFLKRRNSRHERGDGAP